jgi:hypothetical protein
MKREKTNRPLFVLDPLLDPEWEADYITDNPEAFLKMVFANQACEIAVDESGETIGRFSKEMMPLATRSRHLGHVCTFIAQRTQQIDPNVRNQCTTLLCFSQSVQDSETLAIDWVDPELKNAYLLNQGEFYLKRRFKEIKKLNAFIM